MNKSASVEPKKAVRAERLIKEVIEPKVRELIVQANEVLAKHGVAVGAEIQWFIDKSQETSNENEAQDGPTRLPRKG